MRRPAGGSCGLPCRLYVPLALSPGASRRCTRDALPVSTISSLHGDMRNFHSIYIATTGTVAPTRGVVRTTATVRGGIMSTLASTTVTVTRIGKHCGAEISGVDLSQPLDDETFAEIRDAFFENEVVFFRNQRLTPQQQVDFTRRFGDLEHHVRKESLL
ncbi:MAG: TauD/TfdA dioxygenase family protein, partial [bacterium]